MLKKRLKREHLNEQQETFSLSCSEFKEAYSLFLFQPRIIFNLTFFLEIIKKKK